MRPLKFLLCLEIKTHDWSASNHNRVSSTRFVIVPKTSIKQAKIYEATVFRKWITGSAGLRSLREGKYRVSLTMAPAFCLGTLSCPNTKRTSPSRAAGRQSTDFWAQGPCWSWAGLHARGRALGSSRDYLLWGRKVVQCWESWEFLHYGLHVCPQNSYVKALTHQCGCIWRLGL